MSRIAVVVPLRPGVHEAAAELVATGPPFTLADSPLDGHCVYLTEHEALFVFEGPGAREVIEEILGEASVWQAAAGWRPLLDGKPRVADSVFAWQRPR
ncbi:MAG TPA: hypothetical protein VKC62_13245 [Gaiellaceae bacterium]|nr:hypothetical protein [Gaiellaceae bacterium]